MSAAITNDVEAREIVSCNPATGEELGRVRNTPAGDVREAVERSRAAFESWRHTPFGVRRSIVMRARDVMLAEMDEIATLISNESGKPFAEAIATEIAPALDLMQYFAKRTERLLRPKRLSIGLMSLLARSSQIVYQPLGVVGIIPAWNYPFTIPIGEATMALMAGNTVVLKPSELTPLVGLKIGEIFQKAGLPENVLQIVTGDGMTGAALVESAPNKIMFTGSVATGKKIAAAAAKNLTPYVLELGGKDPMIVLEDADLEIASSGAVWGGFVNSGQACASVERLYVHESVAEKFTQLVVEKVRALRQRPGSDPDADVGAMISERQLAIVEDHVRSFEKDGAKVVLGGHRNTSFKGTFFEPTVITGATNEMRAMREETFGPTLPIATFRSDEEAVRLANDTEFGLTASVWTRDIGRGKRIARMIEAATVTVNEVLYTHGIAQTPWGGFKNSGLGRTHGMEGLGELVAPQHIHVNLLSSLPSPWWLPYSPQALKTFRLMATEFASGSMTRTTRMVPALLRRVFELRRKTYDHKD